MEIVQELVLLQLCLVLCRDLGLGQDTLSVPGTEIGRLQDLEVYRCQFGPVQPPLRLCQASHWSEEEQLLIFPPQFSSSGPLSVSYRLALEYPRSLWGQRPPSFWLHWIHCPRPWPSC